MIKREDLPIRDPYILPYRDGFVLTGSFVKEVGFYAYFTKDLKNFEGPYALYREKDPDIVGWWAPELHEYQGRYYLFCTLVPKDGLKYSVIMKSDDPLGEFTPLCRITPEGWESLDATLYVENGTPYAVFCHEWVQVGDGEMCAVQLADDLSRPIGEPFLLFHASEAPWSCRLAWSERDSYVTDGPFLYHSDNELKMLWSTMGANGYVMGSATSESGTIKGPWHQAQTPIVSSDGGHGMVFQMNDEQWLTYHQPNSPGGAERMHYEHFL